MVVYCLFVWLRHKRQGRLEAQRKRACMLMLTVLSLIFLHSGRHALALDTWIEATGMAAGNARTLAARLSYAAHAAAP